MGARASPSPAVSVGLAPSPGRVERVLEILRTELMVACSRPAPSLKDLKPSMVVKREANIQPDRLEQALARIADPKGEGKRACLTVYAMWPAPQPTRPTRARAWRIARPLDGAIVSIKDLFDVAGEPTRAGSKILAEEAAPAAADATIVRRLRAGGGDRRQDQYD